MNHRAQPITLAAATLLLTLGCGDRGASNAEPSSALPASTGEADLAEVPRPQERPSTSHSMEPAADPSIATNIDEAPSMEETAAALDAPAPQLFSVAGLELRRLVVARGVSEREPVDAGNTFDLQPRPLYAFVDVANVTEEDAEVVVHFERPDGQTVGHVSLDIPAQAPRWRTWGYSRMIDRPGAWVAIVRTRDGELLGRLSFNVRG